MQYSRSLLVNIIFLSKLLLPPFIKLIHNSLPNIRCFFLRFLFLTLSFLRTDLFRLLFFNIFLVFILSLINFYNELSLVILLLQFFDFVQQNIATSCTLSRCPLSLATLLRINTLVLTVTSAQALASCCDFCEVIVFFYCCLAS